MSEPIRRWKLQIEDENGDTEYLRDGSDDFEMAGTYYEALRVAERMADEWEMKLGGLVLVLKLESHGKIGT
jgi:hypothetical protein